MIAELKLIKEADEIINNLFLEKMPPEIQCTGLAPLDEINDKLFSKYGENILSKKSNRYYF